MSALTFDQKLAQIKDQTFFTNLQKYTAQVNSAQNPQDVAKAKGILSKVMKSAEARIALDGKKNADFVKFFAEAKQALNPSPAASTPAPESSEQSKPSQVASKTPANEQQKTETAAAPATAPAAPKKTSAPAPSQKPAAPSRSYFTTRNAMVLLLVGGTVAAALYPEEAAFGLLGSQLGFYVKTATLTGALTWGLYEGNKLLNIVSPRKPIAAPATSSATPQSSSISSKQSPSEPEASEPYLGLTYDEDGQGRPVVTELAPNGPAARAGLMVGDIITNTDILDNSKMRPGMDVIFKISRTGKPIMKITVQVEAAPKADEEPDSPAPEKLSATSSKKSPLLTDANPQSGYLGLAVFPEDQGTMFITQVDDGSPAQTAGFMTGDVIKSSYEDFVNNVLNGTQPGTKLTFNIERDGSPMIINITAGPVPGDKIEPSLADTVAQLSSASPASAIASKKSPTVVEQATAQSSSVTAPKQIHVAADLNPTAPVVQLAPAPANGPIGYLGIAAIPTADGNTLVTGVKAGSPAESVGLKKNDLIQMPYIDYVKGCQSRVEGETYSFKVIRDGGKQMHIITIKAGPIPGDKIQIPQTMAAAQSSSASAIASKISPAVTARSSSASTTKQTKHTAPQTQRQEATRELSAADIARDGAMKALAIARKRAADNDDL